MLGYRFRKFLQVSRVADQAKRGGSKDFMGVMSQYQSNNGFLSGLEEEEDNISKIVGKYLKHDLKVNSSFLDKELFGH